MDDTSLALSNKYVRLGLAGLAGLVVIAIIFWLVSYLTTGQLVITTNDPKNIITISGASGSGSGGIIKQGVGGLSVRLHPGQYTASVQNRVFETSRFVKVMSRKRSVYKLDVRVAGAIEPVLPTGAYDVIIGGGKLLFVDTSSGGLYQVSGSGSPALISNTIAFKGIKWASTSLGLGQGKDGQLYLYENGSVTPLQAPFTYASNVAVDYAITASGSIYVSSGSNVYAVQNSAFKKIYTAKSSAPSLVAGKEHLAIIDNPGSGEGQNSSGGSTSLTIFDGAGHKLTKDIEASALAWAPDDNHLAVSSELGNKIYTADLGSNSSYPGPNVNSLAWLDKNTLLYGLSGSLWSYDILTGQSTVIANTPLQGAISGVYPDLDGNYVYLTVAKSSSTDYELDRVGLRGQNVPDYILQLAVYFPKVLDDCSASYINFLNPTILLQSNTGLQQICLSEANGELNKDGIEASKFQFLNVPLPTIWPY